MILNKNISKLDLSNKNLKKFPEEIFELKNLKKLNLSNNLIKEIPREIESLSLLETLDLSNNQISNLFSKVCNLKNLKILNLNNNKIKSLPTQISRFDNLISLHMSNNNMITLPAELFSIYSLRELDLSRNNLSKLSPKISQLSNLRKLWLNSLELDFFPTNEIKNMENLLAIYCFGSLSINKNLDKTYIELSKVKGNSLLKLKFNEVQKDIITEIAIQKEVKLTDQNNKIFISYSHQDKQWLKRIQTHLNVLKNSHNIDIDVWDDEKLRIGDDWEKTITKSLNECDIAILIVSTDFLASEFITKKEIPPLLNANKKKLLPIIAEHCMFDETILSKIQATNPPSEPLSSLSKPDSEIYILKLMKRIKNILTENKNLVNN